MKSSAIYVIGDLGAIIATALYPVAKMLQGKFKISQAKASWLLVLCGVLVLIVPTYLVSDSLFTTASDVYDGIQEARLSSNHLQNL
ncbi:hypothetical protein JCM19236_2239 [Vibrio sp. JCM 19236]|nr:hypothetical protein JCM19236_2239 [Vibrio sp. JCM 19236]